MTPETTTAQTQAEATEEEKEMEKILAIIKSIRPQLDSFLMKNGGVTIKTIENPPKITLEKNPEGVKDIKLIIKTVAAQIERLFQGKKIETIQTENKITIKEEEEIAEDENYYKVWRNKPLDHGKRLTVPVKIVRDMDTKKLTEIYLPRRQGHLLAIFSKSQRMSLTPHIHAGEIDIKKALVKKVSNTTVSRLLLSKFINSSREKAKEVDIYFQIGVNEDENERLIIIVAANPLEKEKNKKREKIKEAQEKNKTKTKTKLEKELRDLENQEKSIKEDLIREAHKIFNQTEPVPPENPHDQKP